MNYRWGVTRWHVVGYVFGDPNPVLLCGQRTTEDDYEGDADDVVLAHGPLCGNCDRITRGEAGREVNAAGRALFL